MNIKVSEIAIACNGKMDGEDFCVEGFASLSKATQNQISFWTDSSVSGEARDSSAGVVFVPEKFNGKLGNARTLIYVVDAYVAMVHFIETFVLPIEYEQGFVAESAQVHKSAIVEGSVDGNAVIGPGCVVMQGANVGAGSVLEANVTIYPGVTVGRNCVIQAGAVIGSRGFGFYFDNGIRKPVPHVAGVSIGNRVGIGANTVVAAGFLSPTEIGDDTQIDSLVQIGHNCTIGRNVYMASQCALAGTTVVEDDVEMAGAAKASGHLTIGKGAKIAAKAGVIKNVPAGKVYAGFPAQEISEWRKQVIALRKIVKMPEPDARNYNLPCHCEKHSDEAIQDKVK